MNPKQNNPYHGASSKCTLVPRNKKDLDVPLGKAVNVASTYYQKCTRGGVLRASRCVSMHHTFRLALDRENKQSNEAIQSDGERTIEPCVPRVVMYYPVGVRMMASPECMGGPWTPSPQSCSAGYSVYLQCILEEYCSEI
ncbi:hypothetical protein TNCV_1709841 [Trichonephila clavipes]|nr:hypothetical protein TNCV_1709841 [Trichonephila clavipes]